MKKKLQRASAEDEPDFFAIDLLQLDKEWVEQPRLYYRYAARLADARLEFEQAKTRLDVTQAEVDADVRKRPERFGLDKVTEAAVKAAILTVKAYADATNEVHELRHKVDILQAAVNALDHRKRALENLVDLHGRDYFSEPRAPENAKEVIAKAKTRRAYVPMDND